MIVDWRHKARAVALAGGVVAFVAAVVARNPEAGVVGGFGLLAVGVPATFVGRAWSFATGVRRG